MAQGFYNAFVSSDGAISAGIKDVSKRYHGHPAPTIVSVMKEKGIDISKQEVKQLTLEMIRCADTTVILCTKDLCPPFLLKEKRILFYEIEDPYSVDFNSLRRIRDKIKNFVLNFERRCKL